MNKFVSLLVFLLLALGGGLLIGLVVQPDEWYAGLAKPAFNPPNWIFGPVWSLLYVLIAIAGWLTWRTARSSAPMKLWVAQLVLNFLWSPTFFGLHLPGLALIIIVILLGTILAFVLAAWPRKRIAAWLFVPYVLWVAFATMLNGSIWWLN